MLTSAPMSARGKLAPLALIAMALGAQGCGSAGFDGQVYRGDQVEFRVGKVPEAWHRIDAPGGVLAFRDEVTPASIAVSGRCGKDGDDVPLEALTAHLFLEFTDRRVEKQERIPFDGREALRTDLLAKLDGVEKRFTVFVLKKNGCVYDFMHIAPPNAPESGREHFVTFVEGFSTIKP